LTEARRGQVRPPLLAPIRPEIDSYLVSGPHSPKQVQHFRLVHPIFLADFGKALEVVPDLIRWHTGSGCTPGTFRLFNGFNVGEIQGVEVRYGSSPFIAHFDWAGGVENDLCLFAR
jgi:hypothetical protein